MAKNSKKKNQGAGTNSPEPVVVSNTPEPTLEPLPVPKIPRALSRLIKAVAVALVVGVTATIGFSLAYQNRVFPGVSVAGASLGGQSREQALQSAGEKVASYRRELIPVRLEKATVRIPTDKLGVTYEVEPAVKEALSYGRRGNIFNQAYERWRAILGRPAAFTKYSYSATKLTPYLLQIDAEATKPVTNATLKFFNDAAQVAPSQEGARLDIGRLTLQIQDHLFATSSEEILAPVYALAPVVDTKSAEAAKAQAQLYLAGPLKLTTTSLEQVVTKENIIDWLSVNRELSRDYNFYGDITGFYSFANPVQVDVAEDKVKAFLAELAKKTDQKGQNAALSITDGRATVFKPSRDGIKLDQDQALADILLALAKPATEREISLKLIVNKPEIREENLNNLGIKELIAEGVSYFPGSNAERIQNVRVGAARFNGVLLKPDEVFSFGSILGDVGPETGYAPARVIIGNRQELQYGGGLCQVSSTAFRAALNAGLPITERHNHSFAVSYYVQPYGVQGVDATIYYPQVDFKFKNDTGSYILIQTIMEGTSLKFHFYGTKVKEGKVRGPFILSGSTDPTQPSRTVFYRDVIKDGQVTETNSFYSSYKSSEDFPYQPQFNG